MEKPEIVQTKFQKSLAKITKFSFWLWITTMVVFAVFVLYVQKSENLKNVPEWFILGDIALGVFTFTAAITGYYISRPRPAKETKSLLTTLGLGVAGLALLIILGMLPSSSGSVNGARIFASPLPPITTNLTPQPTPAPNAKTTTTLPKSPQITCTGPDYKTFQTTESECIKFRTAWGLPPSATTWPTSAPNKPQTITTGTYTQTYYPPCSVYYPILKTTSTYYNMTPEWCSATQKSASSFTSSPIPTYTPQPTPNIDTASLISQCKANVDAKYYPIFQRCNSYDAATHQFCYETNTNNKNAEYGACNSLGN